MSRLNRTSPCIGVCAHSTAPGPNRNPASTIQRVPMRMIRDQDDQRKNSERSGPSTGSICEMIVAASPSQKKNMAVKVMWIQLLLLQVPVVTYAASSMLRSKSIPSRRLPVEPTCAASSRTQSHPQCPAASGPFRPRPASKICRCCGVLQCRCGGWIRFCLPRQAA